MKAQVDQKFRSGFELSEESLVKIGDILQSRLQEEGETPAKLSIDVKRVDHALITYDNMSDVLKEENGRTDRINFLRIYNQSKGDDFSIEFEKGEKTRLKIISESRDRALLALSDLREYIKNEVIVHRLGFIHQLLNNRSSLPIVLMLSMMTMLARITILSKQQNLSIPVNPDTAHQVEYLYNSRVMIDNAVINENIFSVLMFWPAILILIFFFFQIAWPFVYHTDIFMWGKEKEKVISYRSIVTKILWTIVVGSIVSIAAGIFVNSLK